MRKNKEELALLDHIKSLEKKLAITKSYTDALVNDLPHCVFRSNTSCDVNFGNKAYITHVNKSKEDVYGQGWVNLFPQELVEKFNKDNRYVIETGKELHIIDKTVSPLDKKLEAMEVVKKPMFDEDNNVTGFQTTFWPITDKLITKESLNESEAWLNVIAKNLPMVVTVINKNGLVLYMQLIGGEIKSGDSVYDFWDYSCHELAKIQIKKVFSEAKSVNFETYNTNKKYWQHRIVPVGQDGSEEKKLISSAVCFSVEITEQKNLELEMKRNEKLSMLGLLVGGAANDFSNLLTVVMGHADMLLPMVSDDENGSKYTKQIIRAVSRCSALNKQLFEMSGDQKLTNYSEINISSLISDMELMLNRLVQNHVNLHFEIKSNAIYVLGDSNQIEQVIMNLVLNSSEAIEDEGTINVYVEQINQNKEIISSYENIPANEYCFIRIKDTGKGMSESALKKLFDPFYTTKKTGKGLGMLNVKNIVKRVNGFVDVKSKVDHGTEMRLYLPVVASSIGDGRLQEKHDRISHLNNIHIGKIWTIMILESDELMRDLLSKVLFSNGYRPIIVQRSDEIISIINQKRKVDLIIIDLKKNTVADIPIYDAISNEIPITYMTGTVDQKLLKNITSDTQLLHKPFETKELIYFINKTILNFNSNR